jgi:hypothetical protein
MEGFLNEYWPWIVKTPNEMGKKKVGWLCPYYLIIAIIIKVMCC